MKKRLIIVSIVILLLLSAPVDAFAAREEFYASKTFADSGILIYEANSDNIIYENNADKKFCPGSITKLLTCLTAMDYMELDDKITATQEMLDLVEPYSSLAHIVEDESLTLTQLLYALLLPSGNDASKVVAVGVGRKILGDENATTEDAYAKFIETMNDKAKAIGMKNSNFTNSDGYDDEACYSTARDVLKLAMVAYENETIRKIAADDEQYIETNRKTHDWESTNKLLFDEDPDTGKNNPYYDSRVVGLKTGFTDIDGRCFSMVADADGMLVFGVYLGMGTKSATMWSYIKKTLNTTYDEFYTIDLMKETPAEYELQIKNHSIFSDETLRVIPAQEQRDRSLLFTKDISAEYIIFMVNYDGVTTLSDEGVLNLERNIKEGEIVSQILVFDSTGEKELARIDYVASKDVNKFGILDFTIKYVLPLCVLAILIVGYKKLKKYDEKIKRENGRKTT
ncbi:MAG: D-alanyl-D-alanine carboxypeptidase [Anaerofustis stercorihominis]|nr:D-alanyl-D-alanine carboxypeptidase [Anaerofustis stercorihominis]